MFNFRKQRRVVSVEYCSLVKLGTLQKQKGAYQNNLPEQRPCFLSLKAGTQGQGELTHTEQMDG